MKHFSMGKKRRFDEIALIIDKFSLEKKELSGEKSVEYLFGF